MVITIHSAQIWTLCQECEAQRWEPGPPSDACCYCEDDVPHEDTGPCDACSAQLKAAELADGRRGRYWPTH